jgi:O-antigen ligase
MGIITLFKARNIFKFINLKSLLFNKVILLICMIFLSLAFSFGFAFGEDNTAAGLFHFTNSALWQGTPCPSDVNVLRNQNFQSRPGSVAGVIIGGAVLVLIIVGGTFWTSRNK